MQKLNHISSMAAAIALAASAPAMASQHQSGRSVEVAPDVTQNTGSANPHLLIPASPPFMSKAPKPKVINVVAPPPPAPPPAPPKADSDGNPQLNQKGLQQLQLTTQQISA